MPWPSESENVKNSGSERVEFALDGASWTAWRVSPRDINRDRDNRGHSIRTLNSKSSCA